MGHQPNTVLRGALILAPLLVAIIGGYLLFGNKKAPDPTELKANPDGAGDQQATSGQQLFANYCAGCHGEKGDGKGPAARFVNPKPRDFGEAKFRLVSTMNMIPSEDDLKMVIRNGMPGSAMFAFHLSDDDVQSLVGHVRKLIREGVELRVRKSAADNGTEIDPDELPELLDKQTLPGRLAAVPDHFPEATKASIARGEELYRSQRTACAACHGPTGKGDGPQEQRNEDGMPTRPRDLTRGIFKSGRDRRQLYLRVFRGLPGSPMPASDYLKQSEITDLLDYILSLSPEEATARTTHRRQTLIAKRVESLPDDIPDTTWATAPALSIVVTPLWWRDYPEPDLKVSAMHDYKTIAIRLTWHDPTRNDHAVRPQDFEDMAAVQLFKGSPEPFLGMGAAGKSLDVWLWRAGWSGKPGEAADVDTVYPNMAVDSYPFEKKGEGPRPHATDRQDKGFLTAHAAGNVLADPSRPLSAGNLGAQGFGSLTMRPRTSQAVKATASWKDGRWTVVLRRALDAGADNGLVLTPGDKASIAFALWDGEARDRNGQKLVSIWHDLMLEK
jgi:mono/diheme cytochrome c family protein